MFVLVINNSICLQYGHHLGQANVRVTVGLPIAYKKFYSVQTTGGSTSGSPDFNACYNNKTLTSFELYRDDYEQLGADWFTIGY